MDQGSGGAGLGAPGQAPGSLSSRGALGRAWCHRPIRDWGQIMLVPLIYSPPAGQAQPSACSEVAESFGFSPLGWVHLPAWARIGGGFEPQQGHRLPCCVSSDNCLPSLSWGSSSVAGGRARITELMEGWKEQKE